MSYMNSNLKYQNFDNTKNMSGIPEARTSNYSTMFGLKQNESVKQYQLFSGANQPDHCSSNLTKSILETNDLNTSFFSQTNVDNLQNKIINQIYLDSEGNYKIGRQSDIELKIIMRSIYLSYAHNDPKHIKEQVNTLNELVIQETVKIIMPGIKQYLGYRKDISKPRTIMPHAVNMSNRGSKTYSLFNI